MKLPRRLIATALTGLLLAFGFFAAGAAPVAAYSGSANDDACVPIYGPSWTNGESENLEQATYSICANIPYGQYGQTDGYTWVTDFVPAYSCCGYSEGEVWFYVQQNPDQYTQLQINGPPGGGNWIWYAYYQQNPPANGNTWWYDAQVNTYSGGPYWHQTGYL